MMPSLLPPERLLIPQCVPVRGKGNRGKMRFQDAFCGAYFTFAVTQEGHIYGFGLSNYHQLGELCLCPPQISYLLWSGCKLPGPVLPWAWGGGGLLLGTPDPEHQAPAGHTGAGNWGGGVTLHSPDLGPSPYSQ